MVNLITERLVLRSIVQEDVTPSYVDWLNDPAINKFLECRFAHHTIDSVSSFVSENQYDHDNILLGLFLKDSNKHIGNIKLGPIDRIHMHSVIGLLIGDKSCWGKGYASEAIYAVTRYAFEELKLIKIEAGCYESNAGSLKAFKKVGYIEEGRLRSRRILDDYREDNILLGILSEEFGQ